MKAVRSTQRHSAALGGTRRWRGNQRHSEDLSGTLRRARHPIGARNQHRRSQSAALTDALVIPLGLARGDGREDVRIVHNPKAVPVRLVDRFQSSRHRLLVGDVEGSEGDERKIVDDLGDGRVELRVLARKGRISLTLLSRVALSRTQSHSCALGGTRRHSVALAPEGEVSNHRQSQVAPAAEAAAAIIGNHLQRRKQPQS